MEAVATLIGLLFSMLFGFGRGLNVSNTIVKKNFQIEEKIKKLSDKVAKFSAERAVDVPVLNVVSGATKEIEKGVSLQSEEIKSSQVKVSDLHKSEEKGNKFSFLISGVKGVCRWCIDVLARLPVSLCKWYVKSMVNLSIFACVSYGVWHYLLKGLVPVDNILAVVNSDVHEFYNKCRLNKIDDCDREVVHSYQRQDRSVPVHDLSTLISSAKLELIKQYVCHKLGLKWYHNLGVGTK